jgi:hypothetical protein
MFCVITLMVPTHVVAAGEVRASVPPEALEFAATGESASIGLSQPKNAPIAIKISTIVPLNAILCM